MSSQRFRLQKCSALFLILFLCAGIKNFAGNPPDEGMWLPILIERLNYVDMQKMGLKLTSEELYNINHSSLKDAIVGLSGGSSAGGFFCTAEVVSGQGLIFTNHHCGFNAVQNHSTTDHDYLTNGFWAYSKDEELPNSRLSASFLVRMENITDSVIPFLKDSLSENARIEKVKELTAGMKKRAAEKNKYEVSIKSFFGGNEYYLFVFKTYQDVRLVGAPPSSIGKFGGDTDNWMWPRHTGDFTIFRIYADSAGNPSNYNIKNTPLKSEYFLPISLKGIRKNDFAMIWGYPGTTTRYLTSYGLEYNLSTYYPAFIDVYGKELAIMKERMDADQGVKIAYAGKYATIANTWKNFIGQTTMLKRNKVEDKKKSVENEFADWYNKDPKLRSKYGNVLNGIKIAYDQMKTVATPYLYSTMAGKGMDIVAFAGQFGTLKTALESNDRAAISSATEGMKNTVNDHFDKEDLQIEKKTFAELLRIYSENVPKEALPSMYKLIEKKYGNDYNAFAEAVYSKSVFASPASTNAFLEKPSLRVLNKDLAYMMNKSMKEVSGKYMPAFSSAKSRVNAGNRLYIAGLREMNPKKVEYPDANSTLRMSYGKVLDYFPADAVHYEYFTTLKGVMQKEDPANEEFIVEKKLKDLYNAKDYGPYGENGEMVTCFLTTNDITGGNSGSPVINADGQLIGLAFDGNWEAMSGDISFEPELQRTINVDIRYVLFIIDKFAGAKNLINEMTLVK